MHIPTRKCAFCSTSYMNRIHILNIHYLLVLNQWKKCKRLQNLNFILLSILFTIIF